MSSRFVVVEGIDGAGTTTASKLLATRLNGCGIDSVWTKEPTDGPVGRHIRRVLRGQDVANEMAMFPLFLADRHDHISSLVEPELQQGSWVICDRYAYSTWVYQQESYQPEVISLVQRHCLAPHYVFVLSPPFELCWSRVSGRDEKERYEKKALQSRYYDLYKSIPSIGAEKIFHLEIEETQSPEDVVELMLGHMGLDDLGAE